jgi:hypothetical protein|tara:strand:+ start:477 stop:683 length:207 start_codon:yes stop_codon:yes gene_type:complete
MCFPIGMKMQSETDSVKYSIDEVASILTELSNIQNAINNLQKEFDLINNAIKNSRLTLHQMDNYEDLA